MNIPEKVFKFTASDFEVWCPHQLSGAYPDFQDMADMANKAINRKLLDALISQVDQLKSEIEEILRRMGD